MPRFLYSLVLYLLLPFIPLRLLWRARKQPEYLAHWGERFGFYRTATPQPLIWIHAVSVGETRAAAPLIDALQARYPAHRILLTCMTPTGRAAGSQLYGERVLQAYLPYDYPGAVRRFLKYFQPAFGLLMETELWPNLIASSKARSVPLALINARLSEKSARGYARFGSLISEALENLPLICAQSAADAERLQQLGATHISIISITGNLKFDVAPPADVADQAKYLRELLGNERHVLLAASTREGEEALLLDALNPKSNFLLVIVPRHPQRFDEVAALLAARGIPYQRRSENAPIHAETRVVLGDSMGEMFAYYGAADVAIIGGSLLPFGGQNLIEACAMGVPVILGPHTYNFSQAAQDAIAAGAALRVVDASAALAQAQRLLEDAARKKQMSDAALEFASAHRGAVEKTMAAIEAKLWDSCKRIQQP
ncbi:MAG: 3-deoxy-D-manno-octulosonic acid transferase [Betaproteobacteria bacterium RBG_16_58_11]|nr:MAG: 3-deoxy-D-manno-octulosonic acid transferase [Betaproteobacteria bacterium RBG_16_58_11]